MRVRLKIVGLAAVTCIGITLVAVAGCSNTSDDATATSAPPPLAGKAASPPPPPANKPGGQAPPAAPVTMGKPMPMAAGAK